MATHKTGIRVRYKETDRMGVAYYGNYLTWFEVARTEHFRALGICYRTIEEKEFLRVMVTSAAVSYKSAVTYDDELSIESDIVNVKNSSMGFRYRVYCGGRLAATGETYHVFTNKEGKPVKIPARIKEALTVSA